MGDITPESLKELRHRLGEAEGGKDISQAELARRIGANGVTVWRWESGIAKPSGIAARSVRLLMDKVGMNGYHEMMKGDSNG